MLWFLVIVIVLVMGAIAVVAAGHGTPLAPPTHDRAGRPVPPGEITPEHLRRVRFALAFRGYRMAEVDELLDRVALHLERDADEREADAPARPE